MAQPHLNEFPQDLVFSGSMSWLVWYYFPLRGSPGGHYREEPILLLPSFVRQVHHCDTLPRALQHHTPGFCSSWRWVPRTSCPDCKWGLCLTHLTIHHQQGHCVTRNNIWVRSKEELDAEGKLAQKKVIKATAGEWRNKEIMPRPQTLHQLPTARPFHCGLKCTY